MNKISRLLVNTLCVLPLLSFAGVDDHYSPGGWPTLHYDAGNRRFVDAPILKASKYRTWTALEGASVLTAPVTSPDGKAIYVTTGWPAGKSNLHAFSIDGKLLWQSEPWQDAHSGVDSCAILSSPIVDAEGDIYINDCNQLFAFKPNGSIKWSIPLPLLQDGDWNAVDGREINALTTAAFTADGNVLGVTNFGDIIIVDRDSGKILNQPFRMDAALSPYAKKLPMPATMLANGLVDPEVREWSWQLIFGGAMRSANTPAVNDDGRLFIVGSSDRDGIGALYGFDFIPSSAGIIVKQVFSTYIGIGSGSSPALSPEGDAVYVSDEDGWLYGINADSGDIIWKVKTLAAAGAAAVGPDGTVYALQRLNGPAVVAVSREGKVVWESDVSMLLEGRPTLENLGSPVGVAGGNPLVTNDALVVPITFGYRMPGQWFPIPVGVNIVALNLATGKAIRSVVELEGESSGITGMLENGTIINSLGEIQTSALTGVRDQAQALLLPNMLMKAPKGGIQVSIPQN